jgi:REP element-mobilizing transposase RayT
MRSPFTQLYLHCVWATWDRLPLVTHQFEQPIYACILNKCLELNCEVLAINGMPDHIHLLVRFPTTLTIADLLQGVKGASSHLVTHNIAPDTFFKWQGAYGAFTVSKDVVPTVKAYIERQKEHHAQNNLLADFETTMVTEQKEKPA